MRFLTVMVSLAAMLTLLAAPILAQTQAPAPPSTSPTPAPATPAPGKSVEKAKEVEGTVKKVDAAARSVQVSSGLLGLFGATLQVTDETRINVQGKDGSLTDIREGATVKASYESRDGKNIAKSIDVMEAEAKPARAGSAPSGATTGAAPSPAPSTGSSAQPKTQ
jgi:Cu/Ag efflux protein CusF